MRHTTVQQMGVTGKKDHAPIKDAKELHTGFHTWTFIPKKEQVALSHEILKCRSRSR